MSTEKKFDKIEHIMTGIVRNKPGVLALIADKFRQMKININSLNTSETDDNEFNCITIVTETTELDAEMIRKELGTVVDIRDLEKLDTGDHYERELALVKVSLSHENMSHIMQISEVFRAHVAGIGKDSITLELVGDHDQIRGFINMLKPFRILGIARTGRTAIRKD